MKFGILMTDSGQIEDRDSEINVGAIWIYQAILNLYKELGVDDSKLIHLTARNIDKYDGDDVVLPICMHIPLNHINANILNCSKRIHPVFLAVSMSATELSQTQIAFLKENEPIGCRDQFTYHNISKYGIKCFVMGCLVLTTPLTNKTKKQNSKKVLFSDVPLFAKEYIPSSMKKEALFVKQELLKSEIKNSGKTPIEFANDTKRLFESEASLVITSRFHAAIMAIVCGVPYFLVNEAYTYRYSWLEKYGNFYTRKNIKDASFSYKHYAFSGIIKKMKELAKLLLLKKCGELDTSVAALNSYENYNYLNIDPLIECISSFFSNSNEPPISKIDYYDGAINYIKRNWNTNEVIFYSFWGINNNAEAIHGFIKSNYPKAKLINVYDAKRTINYNGKISVNPKDSRMDEFVFVTTFVAKGEALELFKKANKDNYYICERTYIDKDNLFEEGDL